ncbi:MAG: hemolysin family protein, partial [Vicinamibacterales bacterium]
TLPMIWIKTLCYPLVIGLNSLGNFILRLMGIDRQTATHERYYTSEELQLVVQESQEAGALPAESGRLLREVLAFGDLTAGQVMAPRVRITGVPLGANPSDVELILRTNPHTRYPIYQDDLDHTIGMLHVKDLLRLILAGEPVDARHARPMPTVPETAPLDAVISSMRRNRAQMALVIDEYGGTAGIVTLQDLFEELVGELHDAPVAVLDIYTDASGRLRVPGTLRLDELGERMGVTVQHEDVDSVSGLVLALLGRPPKVGDIVRHEGLQLEVTFVRGHGVEQCAVSRAE